MTLVLVVYYSIIFDNTLGWRLFPGLIWTNLGHLWRDALWVQWLDYLFQEGFSMLSLFPGSHRQTSHPAMLPVCMPIHSQLPLSQLLMRHLGLTPQHSASIEVSLFEERLGVTCFAAFSLSRQNFWVMILKYDADNFYLLKTVSCLCIWFQVQTFRECILCLSFSGGCFWSNQ